MLYSRRDRVALACSGARPSGGEWLAAARAKRPAICLSEADRDEVASHASRRYYTCIAEHSRHDLPLYAAARGEPVSFTDELKVEDLVSKLCFSVKIRHC